MSASQDLILVVEDEQVVAMDLELTLRALGYRVIIANNGDTAVQLAADERPQAVLMDVRIQGRIDGIDTAAQIGALHDVPIIYLSAYSDEPTRRRAAETAPYGYIVKPFDERTLLSTIEMALVRHRHDRELKDREAWYRTILESIGDAVVTTDADAQVTYINPVAAHLMELTPDQAIGRPIDEVMYLIDPQAHRIEPHPLIYALRNCETVTIEADVRLRTHNDHEIWIADTIAPIRHVNESPLGAVMIFRDDQSRRDAEEERLHNQQSRVERQYLERLRILAGGVAHDLNNLLTGILGYGEIARQSSHDPAAVNEAIAHMEQICYRATDLTKQLLAYAGRVPVSREVLDLNRIIRDVVEELRATHLRHVSLRLDLADHLPTIRGDPVQIYQVMLNLLTNAAEAVAPNNGGIRVETQIQELTPTASRDLAPDPPAACRERVVLLRVSDSGHGIPPDVMSHIFEPFFSTRGLGRGLGLASVIGTIHAHDGTISVASTPGVGTAFTISLPALDQPPPPPSVVADTLWHGHGTVLVIDDEPPVREITQRFLQRLGFDVLLATGGGEGLVLFAENQAAIVAVMLDLSMPGMHGSDVARQLRAIDPQLPILFMSGYSQEDAADLLRYDTATRFLAKPFTLETLRNQLRNFIRISASF